MPVSEARLNANRRNAAKSTGPRTPEGRARSRRNALKHGLTGEGVALPDEDAVEVARRFEALGRELNPSSEVGKMLVHRVAFLSVRLERCERFDTAVLSKRVRKAEAEFADARLVEVEALVLQLPREAATSVRRLKGSPEGVDWLLGHLAELKGDLLLENRDGWTPNHRMRLEAVLGQNPGGYRINRVMALSDAILGYFGHLDPEDGEGLDDGARARWAKGALAAMIDAEAAHLQAVRAALDPRAIEQDRLEAADRALFDPSPKMVLARKYEAATERGLYKALKELQAAELAFEETPDSDVKPCEEETCGAVASNFPGADPGPLPEPDGAKPPRRSAPQPVLSVEIEPSSPPFAVRHEPNAVPITIGRASPGLA